MSMYFENPPPAARNIALISRMFDCHYVCPLINNLPMRAIVTGNFNQRDRDIAVSLSETRAFKLNIDRVRSDFLVRGFFREKLRVRFSNGMSNRHVLSSAFFVLLFDES